MAKSKTPSRPAATARLDAIRAEGDDAVVYKAFTASVNAKRVDEQARTVEFVITTDRVDRDNDVIDPKGWEIDDFLKSPVVLWAHDYAMPPVARATEVTQMANGLKSTAQFPEKGLYPFADMIFDLIKGGFINTSSVGFHPSEAEKAEDRDGLNFTRQSLLEWSIVPVPANADALVVARSKGVDLAPMKQWARKFAKDVPDPGMADDSRTICPACGSQYDGEMCPGCGHHEDPMDVPGPTEGRAATRRAATSGTRVERLGREAFAAVAGALNPKNVLFPVTARMDGAPRVSLAADGTQWRTYVAEGDDPVRWNRQLSKAFDVAGEPLEASKLEHSWVSRYLDTPIQQLSVETFEVPGARIGSFLSSLEEGLSAWSIDACRNITDSGREIPPEYESIQLNSTRSAGFLVEGVRFMHRADGAKMVTKLRRAWYGLFVTNYVRHEQSEVRTAWVQRLWQRAGELNFLKGEAFTLSGEFLDRGNLDWTALYLQAEHEKVLRRAVERINEQGGDLPSRGVLLMGPPGTGKTLSGRVMMRQAETTYVWISARDFYRAGSFGAFSYAFDIAAECAPCVLFFEDCDNWLGPETIDLLKTEMDGLKQRKGILTVLTTNFPELLPEALIDRPGRFHDVIEMSLPDEAVRLRMLDAWAADAAPSVRAQLAKDTDGMSGAHLRELTQFARTLAGEEQVTLDVALSKALAKLLEQRELIASLHRSPDYRPHRQVRALVAGTVAKGLWPVKGTPCASGSDDDDEDEEMAVEVVDHKDDDEPVLQLADEPEPVVDAGDLRDAVTNAVRDALRGFVQTETQAALARARGRVD